MFPFITNTYTYGNPDQPHTLTSISGWLRSSSTYTWDANGNMPKQGSIKLEWDEENRLKGVTKSAQGVCFAYDASGERFYKNSGPMTTLMVNGRRVRLPLYGAPVLYTSPYVVVTPNGYTKHYFVENERFASRIGDGNITGLNSHATTNAALAAKQLRVNKDAPDSIPPGQFYNFRTLPAHWSSRHTTYWQHPDHLGSASWVTDTNGRGYQHFQYRAWGEPFIEQNSTANGYETRYTFSGKERDEETGYSYFGARYYNSDLSIWLSVDPMADKYPSLSPYTYCADNPVRLVDPDGEEIEYNSFADRIIVGVLKIFDQGFRNQFRELKKSEETYVFNKNNQGTNSFIIDGNKLFINYSMADNGYSKNAGQTIFSNLRHETTHGIQFEYGELGFCLRRMGYGIVDRDGNYYEIQKWQPFAYDLTDEYEAHNNQNLGFRWNGGKNDSRNQWRNADKETRMQGLKNVDEYSKCPEYSFNCPNDKRIKSGDTYALPPRERPNNLSYGKSFVTPPISQIAGREYVHPIFPQNISILKNDTVFCYNLYITDNAVDSISLEYFSVKTKGGKYIRTFNDGSYWFIRYKKIGKHASSDIVRLNLFVGKVVKAKSIFRYDKEGNLIEYIFFIAGMSFSKHY